MSKKLYTTSFQKRGIIVVIGKNREEERQAIIDFDDNNQGVFIEVDMLGEYMGGTCVLVTDEIRPYTALMLFDAFLESNTVTES